jgi:hypothetical protein
MIPTRKTEDLLLGSWELIRQLGRVPRRLIWDSETGIGRGGKLAEGVAAFTGTLATRIVQLRPRDPESKGIVERRNGYFETSFMPGRSFASPGDFNAQFADWLDRANGRVVRTLRARPADLIEADRAAMLPLPANPPTLGWHHQVQPPTLWPVRSSCEAQRTTRSESGADLTHPSGYETDRPAPASPIAVSPQTRRRPTKIPAGDRGPGRWHLLAAALAAPTPRIAPLGMCWSRLSRNSTASAAGRRTRPGRGVAAGRDGPARRYKLG